MVDTVFTHMIGRHLQRIECQRSIVNVRGWYPVRISAFSFC